MRIVVLDEFGLSPADATRLAERGEVSIFADAPAGADELVARAGDAEVVLTGWGRLDAATLARLPRLRLVSVASTGVDNVDLEAAGEAGVTVCRVPSYATDAVAELAVGLMFAVVRWIPAADRGMRRTRPEDWAPYRGRQVRGSTLGIVGTGEIGRRVARIGHGLGMKLLGHDVRPAEALEEELGLRYVRLGDLLRRSDVVTLHAPLLPETEHLLDAEGIESMRPHAVAINTARSELVDQDALCAALVAGTIAGAGLDVVDLQRESGRRLLELDNVVCTPHIGFNTEEAVAMLAATATENVLRFLDGEPVNVVNWRAVA